MNLSQVAQLRNMQLAASGGSKNLWDELNQAPNVSSRESLTVQGGPKQGADALFKQMQIQKELENREESVNTAPNPGRSPSWMDLIDRQTKDYNTERDIANRERDRVLMENAPPASPQDLAEFGLDPQGNKIQNNFHPRRPQSTWGELDRYLPSPNYRDTTQEMERMMDEMRSSSSPGRSQSTGDADQRRRSNYPFLSPRGPRNLDLR